MGRHRFRNWARTHSCLAEVYHQPASEDELVALVRAAVSANKRLRVVGAGHSWNDSACTDEWLVNLDRYGSIVSIDREALTVTAQAGMRLEDLNTALATAGFALSAQGSVAKQSLGGLVGTGTHGTGIRFANFSGQLTALRLVTADAQVRALSPEDGPLFSAACLALGCLGIVSTVTLRIEPAFRLEERAWSLSFDEAVEQVDALVAAHEHLKLWWVPHTDRVQVYAQDRTDAPATRRTLRERWEASAALRWVFTLLLGLGRWVPALIPAINGLIVLTHFRAYRRVAVAHEVFNIPMPPRHDETEWGIDAGCTQEALRALRALIATGGHRVNFIVEVRFVAADEVMLSPAYQRPSCQLGGYSARGAASAPYLKAFETLMVSLGGRPHWGKAVGANRPTLEAALPELTAFDTIRQRLDPDGRFVNRFVAQVFDQDPGTA
ncbi:MAG: D-arabinono-1,4-lactone oxidase [Myxococcota bacterium]|nr:D-arabinono-1,4-lactone oxidase [Myxococcota bacterium]